jgi:hypothetical protein
VGWAIAPTIGVAGLTGGLMKMVLELAEVQPFVFEVTVNEYEFTAKFGITTEVPIPDKVALVAGLEPIIVTVHPPELGKLTSVTEPVAKIQVGCVGTPAIGVWGTDGTTFIFTEELGGEVQPATVFTYWKEKLLPGVKLLMAAIFPTPDCVKPAGIELTVQPDAGRPER